MNTNDVILHGGILLVVTVFLGSLGNIFYNHYVDREYHLQQLEKLESLIVPESDWLETQTMLEEKGYKLYPIHTEVSKEKDQYYRCCWPLRKSLGNNDTDYQVKLHYATCAVICVSPENKIKFCKGNVGSGQ